MIGVQDGEIIFSSRVDNLSSAEILLRQYENKKLQSPEWIMDILTKHQNKILRDSR